jgi:hypothetical protein
MLAVPAAPFDSTEYSFEFKWNGIRALAAVEAAQWRLWSHQRADYTDRYPELELLRRLPAGTLVDGELVACHGDGRPDLPRQLRRDGLTNPWRMRQFLPSTEFRPRCKAAHRVPSPMQGRYFDPLVGYFTRPFDDYASPPQPSASEPVKPSTP